jgi:hypothetical protein
MGLVEIGDTFLLPVLLSRQAIRRSTSRTGLSSLISQAIQVHRLGLPFSMSLKSFAGKAVKDVL